MSASDFDNVLNECLEMLSAGQDVSQCLAAYPEHASELAPLLRVASATMRLSHSIAPSAEAKARGLARMNDALANGPRQDRRRFGLRLPNMARLLPRPISAPIAAAFAVVFLTIVAAGGTTMASSDSVPGEPLYWVKSAREMCEERIARSAESKAQVHARHARERGREMGELIARGRLQDAERVVIRLQYHLTKSADHMGIVLTAHSVEMPSRAIDRGRIPSANALKRMLAHDEAYVKGQLSALTNQLPEPEAKRVWRLMRKSDFGYRVVIVALEEHSGAAHDGYYGYGIGKREILRYHD